MFSANQHFIWRKTEKRFVRGFCGGPTGRDAWRNLTRNGHGASASAHVPRPLWDLLLDFAAADAPCPLPDSVSASISIRPRAVCASVLRRSRRSFRIRWRGGVRYAAASLARLLPCVRGGHAGEHSGKPLALTEANLSLPPNPNTRQQPAASRRHQYLRIYPGDFNNYRQRS